MKPPARITNRKRILTEKEAKRQKRGKRKILSIRGGGDVTHKVRDKVRFFLHHRGHATGGLQFVILRILDL